MKSLVLAFFILALTLSQEIDKTYSYQDFFRQFRDSEKQTISKDRQKIFIEKYKELLELQKQGGDLQVTRFLDWFQDQLKQFFNYSPDKMAHLASSPPPLSAGLSLSPATYDWRTLNRVTPVKNQGNCGSCWAFSATAQIQSAYAIATGGIKNDFSQQYILSCSGPNSLKCNGGYPWQGLQLFNRTGIPFENTYPYVSSASFVAVPGICTPPSNIVVRSPKTITNIIHYSSLTVEQLQQYLYDYGPLSIAVWANNPNFQYSKGLIQCPGFVRYDHAVLLVGYNSTHWFIKNSWGTNWGDGGYGYISKTPGKNCGIGGWVDVMFISYGTPNPTPPPTTYITLSVSLSDTYGDGWNSNIIGFMQNDVIVKTFGQNFINGKAPVPNPINITIPSNLQTQIVVAKLASWSNEIGFIVKYLNGTLIHQRTPATFSSQTVFANFCPVSPCVVNPTVTFYVTLKDSGNNGWQGIWLAFRQNGILQPFTLASGSSNNVPLEFKLNRNFAIDIIVYQIGTATTKQIGYQVRTFAGVLAASRTPGTAFSANQILGSFNPSTFNLNFVPLAVESEAIKTTRQDENIVIQSPSKQLDSYKVAVYVLSPLLLIFVITSIVGLVKSLKYKKQLGLLITTKASQNAESVKDLANQNHDKV